MTPRKTCSRSAAASPWILKDMSSHIQKNTEGKAGGVAAATRKFDGLRAEGCRGKPVELRFSVLLRRPGRFGRFQRFFENLYPSEAGKQPFSCLFSCHLGVFKTFIKFCSLFTLPAGVRKKHIYKILFPFYSSCRGTQEAKREQIWKNSLKTPTSPLPEARKCHETVI